MNLTYSYSYQVGKPKPSRTDIMGLQAAIAELDSAFDPNDLNTHHFAPGIYGREMFIPKDSVVVGKIHKHAHLNVITKGVIKVVTEFGEDIYEGPKIWVSEPGTKRAVYALEDTQWLCVHPNVDDTRDLEELERFVIAESYDELDKLLIEEKH